MMLHIIKGVRVYQEPDLTIHFVADLCVDVDGAPHSYRLDNNPKLAMDDIRNSAGYPHGTWWNILVRDPDNETKPYLDADGYCVSMTSYERDSYDIYDRRRYVDASTVPYAVLPSAIRKMCKGVVLGCAARITRLPSRVSLDCVCADLSGYSIGEASDYAAKFFDPKLSARNGDDHRIYLYEFFPNQPAYINGEHFKLQPR